MIDTLKLSASQYQLCKDIKAYFTAMKVGAKTKNDHEVTKEDLERWNKGLFRRVELREAHEVLRKHVSCPYFITKNKAAKAAKALGASLYNLDKIVAFGEKHPPAEEEPKAEKPAKKPAKKEAKGKKEAKPAKGKKEKKTETETPTEEKTEEAPFAEAAAAESAS